MGDTSKGTERVDANGPSKRWKLDTGVELLIRRVIAPFKPHTHET